MVRRVFVLLVMVLACAAATAQAAGQQVQPKILIDESLTKVNINTAAAAQFEALAGIGPKMAERIVEYRTKNGPFKKVEELMNVKGMGEKSFLKLKPYLTIGAQKADKAAGDPQ
jgi:competence protein ComEA